MISTTLAAMPPDWIAQMRFAAAQGNDIATLNLIAQIPPQYQALTQELTNLVESYQFERIQTLVQPANQNNI